MREYRDWVLDYWTEVGREPSISLKTFAGVRLEGAQASRRCQLRLAMIEGEKSLHSKRQRARDMEDVERSDIERGGVFSGQFDGVDVSGRIHGANDQGSDSKVLMEKSLEFVNLIGPEVSTIKTQTKSVKEFELTKVREDKRRSGSGQNLLRAPRIAI